MVDAVNYRRKRLQNESRSRCSRTPPAELASQLRAYRHPYFILYHIVVVCFADDIGMEK